MILRVFRPSARTAGEYTQRKPQLSSCQKLSRDSPPHSAGVVSPRVAGTTNFRFGSILLKISVSQQHENSSEFFNRLVRASQINCAVLSRVWLDFHATSATPSYIQYAMPLKSQIKSPLISKQSFSTE
jgi:hypothetical protein